MHTRIILATAVIWILVSIPVLAIDWPTEPQDSAQPLGNSWGEYQYYGGSAYLHPGIDIMTEPLAPVYAVTSGWVKAVLTTYAEYHWRVAIGASSGASDTTGWLYAHLEEHSIMVDVGDFVTEGELLGYIVTWPVADFHHLHFAKIRHSGTVWNYLWDFAENPLNELSNIDDFDPPVFSTLPSPFDEDKFAFISNDGSEFFFDTDSLSGDVDIIAKVYDLIGHDDWRLTPYKLEYLIRSCRYVADTVLSFVFAGELFWEDNVDVIYENTYPLETRGDYNYRDFYFIITNSDGDSVIESSDADECWHTADLPNETYWIVVKASDAYGNETYDSMKVNTVNYVPFEGTVGTSDGDPDSSRAVVSIPLYDFADTTDTHGIFQFAEVLAGSLVVLIEKPGYIPCDTLVPVYAKDPLNITLDPASFIPGDADLSGFVDIDDIVYLIAYVFTGGPSPAPYLSGEVDGSGNIDIDDIVYLIQYIFNSGPPPVE